MAASRNAVPATRQAGYVLIAGLFLVLLVSGLVLGLMEEGRAARAYVGYHEENLKALEMAETGLVRAQVEIRAQVDFGSDGVGNTQGTIGDGSFAVRVFDDPASEDRWILRATGTHGRHQNQRRVEVGVRRRRNSMFADALFAMEDLVLSNTTTDAYRSSAGTYASQATRSDAAGTYAEYGGSIGSNGDIFLDGTAVWVRGNAIPGPLRTVTMAGSPTVQGDMVSREFEFPMNPVPQEDFAAALATNDNASIKSPGSGNTVRYNDRTMTLDVAGDTHATLPGGTYFFRDLFLRGGSSLEFTGPASIYVTGTFEIAAGSDLIAACPADCRIYAHPYPLPGAGSPTCSVKVNGGSNVTWALYAPGAHLDIGGGNHFYGAAVTRSVDLSGTNAFHYDKDLLAVGKLGVAIMERLWWRELSPPRR